MCALGFVCLLRASAEPSLLTLYGHISSRCGSRGCRDKGIGLKRPRGWRGLSVMVLVAASLASQGLVSSFQGDGKVWVSGFLSLLATGAVHHHLVGLKMRTRAGLLVETAEMGFGVSRVLQGFELSQG